MTCVIVPIEKKLDALGLTLMDLDRAYRANASGARFVSHLAVGNLLYCSGTTPVRDGRPYLLGVVGADLSLEQGYEAARYALLSSLAAIKYALGDLDRVEQAVQLIGFVNSAPGFNDQPRVINGATDLLVELYGDRGKPTRAAIGCQGLALGHSVEVVLTVLFRGEGTTPPLARDRYVK
jgi:enamine deaminase RidA (YjgF/YER057c/UK114 family)